MITELKVSARTLQGGAGIYETEKNYLKLFITDGGRVIPTNTRGITDEDLITAYNWGRLEEREAHALDEEIGVEESPEYDHSDFDYATEVSEF